MLLFLLSSVLRTVSFPRRNHLSKQQGNWYLHPLLIHRVNFLSFYQASSKLMEFNFILPQLRLETGIVRLDSMLLCMYEYILIKGYF